VTTLLPDPWDVRLALRSPAPLREFNDAGVLAAADVHVAVRLARLGGEEEDDVILAAALAVRAPRLGHVCVDLATIRDTVTVDVDLPVDLTALAWPEPREWLGRVGASPLVGVGEHAPADRPLRLVGSLLYLDRYWREERQVARDLRDRAAALADGVDHTLLADGLARLFFDEPPDLQRLAAARAVERRLAVIAGGPGTGKTTTVARILALLDEQAAAAGGPPPLVALAAPTGKAAARLEESVHDEARRLGLAGDARARLLALSASTLHRLLGWRPGSSSRFRHHRGNRLPHDVLVVDETSMVSLTLMARLLEAVRAGARLILVGDPQQLASIEAGAVLGDIVGPAADGPQEGAIGDGIVVLRRVHRFGGGIARLAEAVRRGDADATLGLLDEAGDDLQWIPVDPAERAAGADLAPVRQALVAAGRRVVEAARDGRGREAIEALGAFRLLCAHRRGPHGVAAWMDRAEGWLAAAVEGFAAEGAWYVGRPLLVTENDYGLRLYNGDTGVVVAVAPDRLAAVFERGGELLELSPTRLEAVDTVYAMTIHKSQGSQFDEVAVLLPEPTSPILTRELLYTAITRARRRLILAGPAESVRAAVERPIARASGLRQLLWS